jgi:hypothetical protein
MDAPTTTDMEAYFNIPYSTQKVLFVVAVTIGGLAMLFITGWFIIHGAKKYWERRKEAKKGDEEGISGMELREMGREGEREEGVEMQDLERVSLESLGRPAPMYDPLK